MHVIKWLLIILGLLITIAVIQVVYETSFRLIFGKASYSTEAVFQVPQTSVEIILERRAIHLFLAEYERTLILNLDGKEVLRRAIAIDTGGYSRMNVYKISPTEYFLSGDLSRDEYELGITQQKLNLVVSAEKSPAAEFVGAFDSDEKRNWRFISADERIEQESKFEK